VVLQASLCHQHDPCPSSPDQRDREDVKKEGEVEIWEDLKEEEEEI
jgi:hypothetical protein